jgi:WD40 repeat protein
LRGVPGQRPNYLRREEYLDQLKQAVLGSTDRAIGITGAGGRVGLHGMGGIGKTVLAIDLVNDAEVRCAFPDGIFWLTLGQSIEPTKLQGELAGFVSGEAQAYATVYEGRDQLRRLFEGKFCLLVLDDLWRPQDAEHFEVLGPRSRLLVTTRDGDLLVALGARELPLDVLSEELALELLASWSGQAPATLPPTAAKVAESCGYLPLALALAGARVQDGASWDDVLSALERGRLEFLDHPYGSVFKSLRLGSNALSEFERDRYFELAVFPEDTEVPAETICTLWRHTGKLASDVSRDLLLRLHRRALLLHSEDGKRISFHDLQHDFLRLNVTSLAKAQAALIDAYRAVAAAGWARGPDDGYFFQHLLQHLAAADLRDDLKALLCNHDWLGVKLRATDVAGVLADYDLAEKEPDFSLIQHAIRLSIPALLRDPVHLPSQLLGRLMKAEGRAVQALLIGAEQFSGRIWLRPRLASLTRPGGPLRQILVGHSYDVTAVAFLTDGRRALSGSADTTLRLWDLTSGECLRTLEGHPRWVSAVALSAEGRRALSGSADGTLRLWDLATGKCLRALKGHTDWVRAVALSAEGQRALSGSQDNTLRLWDLATGQTIRTLEGHTAGVNAVALSADGRRALSGSGDHTLRLWDLATGEGPRTLEGHSNEVRAVALSADGNRALSGSADWGLRLWDLATGESLRTLEGHTRSVNAVGLSADGSRALSGSYDNTLRLWDVGAGRPPFIRRILRRRSAESLRTFERRGASVTAVALFADGSRAVSGSYDNRLRFLSNALGAEQNRPVDLAALALPRPGAMETYLLSSAALWELIRRILQRRSAGSLRTFEGHADGVTAVALSADGRFALSGSQDNTLRLWDLATGNSLRTLEHRFVTSVALSADGSRALSGSVDETLRLWDLATGKCLRTLEGHTDWVQAVALSADANRALSGSNDRTLRLWDLATGESLAEYVADAQIGCAAFARNDLIVAGSADGKIHILEIREPGR